MQQATLKSALQMKVYKNDLHAGPGSIGRFLRLWRRVSHGTEQRTEKCPSEGVSVDDLEVCEEMSHLLEQTHVLLGHEFLAAPHETT